MSGKKLFNFKRQKVRGSSTDDSSPVKSSKQKRKHSHSGQKPRSQTTWGLSLSNSNKMNGSRPKSSAVPSSIMTNVHRMIKTNSTNGLSSTLTPKLTMSSTNYSSAVLNARLKGQQSHATNPLDDIINQLHSPRRSLLPTHMTRPMTERTLKGNGNKPQQKIVHKTIYSVFSNAGMESLMNRLQRTSKDTFTNGNSTQTPRLQPYNNLSKKSSSSPTTAFSLLTGGRSRKSSLNVMAEEDTVPNSSSTFILPSNVMKGMTEEDINAWDHELTEWEVTGEWIECRETLTGRVMWYNSLSNRIIFDSPPDGVQPLQHTIHTKSLGPKSDDYFLSRPLIPYEDEDAVQGLLKFDDSTWDFNNHLVDVYRTRAAMRDHIKMLPKPQQYCFPEYFSMSPLPELPGGRFLAKIRLPEEFSAHRRYSSVQIKVDYTAASDAIKQGVDKLDEPFNTRRQDYILKVVGQEAYMYGRRKIIDYEAVRDAVRNEDDVEFVLIQRSDFKEKVAEAKLHQLEYAKLFSTAYPSHLVDNASETLKYDYNVLKDTFPSMNHKKHKSSTIDFMPQQFISLYDCDWHYRIKIEGLTNVTSLPRFDDQSMKSVFVVAELWMGDLMFDHATLLTRNAYPSTNIRWGQWLSSRNQMFSQIPRESVLCFMVMGIKEGDNKPQCLSYCRLPLIDHCNRLRSGKYLLNMWQIPVFKLVKDGPKHDPYFDRPFRYRGCMRDRNIKQMAGSEEDEYEQCRLLIEFDEFAFDVVAPKYLPKKEYSDAAVGGKLNHTQLSKQQKASIHMIINKTPLEVLEQKDKHLIWQSRDLLWHDPSALPAFLRSVNWTNLCHISETHKYLDLWASPKRPENAIEFLDYRFADTRVREKALEWLEDLHDADLQKYLLQLVQCLKYEPQIDSTLSRFLIRRGLKSPYQIGHFLFWHLKAEYHKEQYTEKFGLLMEEYLLHAGMHTEQLFVQHALLKRLELIAGKIQVAKRSMSPDQCKRLFRKELYALNKDLPDMPIQIPLNPKWSAKKIIIDECRYMSSKKVPLWLVFENGDEYAPPIKIMFKSGDDLRQDMLTLQIITIMDRLWLDNKLDLHLKPYSVLATGVNRDNEGVGLLEMVLQSCTVNTINVKYGGAFNEKTIDSFLRKYNTYDQSLSKARETFARSCAGYCVATWVLGIGDRHSDNYMVTQNGQFFHIDFGHFLGNFKSKFGFRRERSPFVFTPQMKFAIDSGLRKNKLYYDFLGWCADSYNVLRARSRLLLVLFALMVGAEMPELMRETDIGYFRQMLNLKYDMKKATSHVNKQIQSALKDKTRLMDNAIHLKVHL